MAWPATPSASPARIWLYAVTASRYQATWSVESVSVQRAYGLSVSESKWKRLIGALRIADISSWKVSVCPFERESPSFQS